MNVYDSHLHVGVLSDTEIVYPKGVKEFVCQYEVKGGLIMPTACVGGEDDLGLYEVLYSEGLKCGFQIALYLNLAVLKRLKEGHYSVKYPFSAFKIHPEAVFFSDNDLEDVCAVIGEMKKPLLIHTGGIDSSHALRFESIVSRYKQQIFVLCHARPSSEAFYLLNKYDNVWIDTAFLSIEKIKANVSETNEDRILFGSDYPINRWFSELTDDEEWYCKQIKDIVDGFSFRVSEKILSKNYIKLFCNE